MGVTLPIYIPLEEAASQHNIPLETLTEAVANGTIKAVKTATGDVLVETSDLEQLIPLKIPFALDPALKGKAIRASEAAEKYGIAQGNLTHWATAGYVKIIERGPKLLVLDESEVKLAADIFHSACDQTGSFVRAGWLLKRTLASLRASALLEEESISLGSEVSETEADVVEVPLPSEELKGQPIRADDAVKKYKISSHSTLAGWRERGVVTVLSRKHRNVLYDEYSVALAARQYHNRKDNLQGVRYVRGVGQ